VRFQASAAKMRSALFRDITQCGVVSRYRGFGTIYRPLLQRSRNPNLSAPYSMLKKSKSIGPSFKAQEMQIYRSHLQGSRNPNLSAPPTRPKKSKPIGPTYKAQEIQTYRSHLRGKEVQILTLGGGAVMLSRKAGNELQLHTA
jgi:hypothetical protein